MSYTQTIYNILRSCGLSQDGALAMLGNFDCESNCEPCRVQGDYSSYRSLSKQYVANITSGRISREDFSTDQKGFGLAQWTYPSRKLALYDYWKASGRALDDVTMQTVFAMTELKTNFNSLLTFLQDTRNLYEATSKICYEFENPAIKNVDARFNAAKRIQHEIDLSGEGIPIPTPTPDPAPTPEPVKDHTLVLRTVDSNCDGFSEIYLLQSLLLCRGYDVKVSGKWSKNLTTAVVDFQRLSFPADPRQWDGIVGKGTWNMLLKR